MATQEIKSSYVPLDILAATQEHGKRVQSGESCGIDELNQVFAYMPGFVNGFYGWPNDGKSVWLDYIGVVKAKKDNWKFGMFKPEDMSTTIINGKHEINADRIYKNLAWTLTGKTWNESFAERSKVKAMTLDEEMEALKFITEHFFVVYPKDRKFKTLKDQFLYMYEKFGINVFNIDGWNAVRYPKTGRDDENLVDVFMEVKESAMETNAVVNIVSHPKSMNDVRRGKGPDAPFKIVDQFMQLGGSAWDMKMDGQFSVYRPNRHIDISDPMVHFWCLKQRSGEIVGTDRGSYERIVFDRVSRQYYFDNRNPMTGEQRSYFSEFTYGKEKPIDNPF